MTTRTVSGQTSTLAWDALRRLTSVTKGAAVTSFVYDADGQRLLRKTASDSVLYLDASTGLSASGQEVKLAGAALTVSRYYNHAGDSVAARRVTTATNDLSWLAADHQGSIVLSANATSGAVAKQRYLPFGGLRGAATVPTQRGYIGQTRDDGTGLLYLNARYYDPRLGRFLSADPVFHEYFPPSHTGYSYALNNPIALSDSSGMDPAVGQPSFYYIVNIGGKLFLFYLVVANAEELVDLLFSLGYQLEEIVEFGLIPGGIGSGSREAVPPLAEDSLEIPDGIGAGFLPGDILEAKKDAEFLPTAENGCVANCYKPPKNKTAEESYGNHNGKVGFLDEDGNVWAPDPTKDRVEHPGGERGPVVPGEWDVQLPDGTHINVAPFPQVGGKAPGEITH